MNNLKILLASLIMVCLLVPAASASNPYAEEEQQMLDLINQEREKNGLSPLSFNPLLNDVASDHSQEMIEKDYFSHNSYDGTSFFTRITNSGYESHTCAENIAFRIPPSVTMAHEGLMNSPGHRANILNPDFNEIGIGIWVGEYEYNGQTYSNAAMYTQNFGWGDQTADPVDPVEPTEPVEPVEPVYPPEINSYSPTITPESVVGEVQRFSITTTDNCDIIWYVNGVKVKTEVYASYSTYKTNAGSAGTSVVKVVAENNNGADSHEWKWLISPANEPDFVVSYDYNNNCRIDIAEVSAAIDDYRTGYLSLTEISELIDYYRSGESCS